MCLAIPGKVLEIQHGSEPLMGKVSFGGINKNICMEWLSDVQVGEYVLAHVGFAISKVNEEEAVETLKLFQEIEGALDELESGEEMQRQLYKEDGVA